MQLLGVWKAAVAEPKLFVERFGIDDQCVPFPLPSRVSIVQRIVVVAAKFTSLLSPVGIYEMPIMIAATGHEKNPAEGFVFDKLITVRHLKLPYRPGRQTIQKHRIVFQKIALSIFEQISRPFLERRYFIHVSEILQQTACFNGDLTPFSISIVELGRAQYPVSPGRGPKRGLPSGQRGVDCGWPASGLGSALRCFR